MTLMNGLYKKIGMKEAPHKGLGGKYQPIKARSLLLAAHGKCFQEVTEVLEHGLKYCLSPRLNPIDKLSIAGSLAERAAPDEKDRCISDAIDSLVCKPGLQKRPFKTGYVVSFFEENHLKLLTSSKEGGFVVLPDGIFKDN
ncbi:hypothetical protein HPB47_024238 [Ixodes persulcatus]|uniref:Uncharacterized protein n=1 Tax=Ixodes persulcatus TaxID=34615 RepID=A0AC60Q4X9_IXOPE|nr:hypothetical protein HPB47_024238 [Ixodes persulcatus]